MSRLGSNYFVTCRTCGGLGHYANQCPVKPHYHAQAQKQVAKGSKDPDVLREVYGRKYAAASLVLK